MTIAVPDTQTRSDVDEAVAALRPPPLPPQEMWGQIRRAAGLSREEVAAAVRVHPMTVWRWEEGHSTPWRRHLPRYSVVLEALIRIGSERNPENSQK